MRVGFFFLGPASPVRTLAIEHLRARGAATAFARDPEAGALPFVPLGTEGYAAVRDIRGVLAAGDAHGLDMAVITWGNTVFLDVDRLVRLMDRPEAEQALVGLRIGEISIVAGRNSPRAPLLDEHCVVLRLDRMRACRYRERPMIQAAHFAEAGGVHAVLQAWVEYSLRETEVCNLCEPSMLCDANGNAAPLVAVPYLACNHTRTITCYPELSPKLARLLPPNLAGGQGEQHGLAWSERYGFWCFRAVVTMKRIKSLWMFRILRKLLRSDHVEFKKRF